MDRHERLLLIVVALATATAVFAIGGAPRWAQAAVAVLAALGVALTTSSRRVFARRSPLVLVLAGACAWTALQLVPLPRGLVELLSPTLAGLRDDGAALVEVTTWSTLSMDPPATLRGLVFFLILASIAVVASRIATSERGRYALHAAVAAVIGIAAVIAGIHELLDATALYGVYEPVRTPTIMGPLLNPNHLGCLMAVGAVLSGGLLLHRKQRTWRRIVWLMAGTACVVVLAMTLSRGAMLALAVGIVILLATMFLQRLQQLGDKPPKRRRQKLFMTTVPIGITIVCGLVVALYIGAGSVMQQLENTSLQEIDAPTSKFAAWRSSVQLIDEAPWTGIGRGAFETAFTRVHPASAFATFSHPENIALQAVVDWGVPAMLLLAFGAGWFLLLAVRRWREGPLAAGALGCIGLVAFQSNFDFGLELLGLAVPFTIVLASVGYVPLKEASGVPLRRAKLVRVTLAIALVASALLLARPLTTPVDVDHLALREAPTPAAIRATITRHPLDYYAYAVYAEQLVRSSDPAAIRMLNHALRLHPTHPGLHRMAARLLLRVGRVAQAEIEYATAIRYSLDLRTVLAEVTAALPAQSAVATISIEREPDHVIRTLQALKRDDLAMLWMQRVLASSPTLHVADLLYSLALSTKRYAAAEDAARARCALLPSNQCHLALARVMQMADNHRGIVATLGDVGTWRGRRDEQRTAWFMLCDAHIAQKHVPEAKECLRRLDASGLIPPRDPDLLKRLEQIAPAAPGHLLVP